MKGYNTALRRRLMDLLRCQPDRMFSVEELAGEMSDCSLSTVYRLLGRLAEEGEVLRLAGPSGRSAVYQYARDSVGSDHLHLRCTRCGRIVCMDPGDTEDIVSRVFVKNNFLPDGEQTLLPGICENCSRRGTKGGAT